MSEHHARRHDFVALLVDTVGLSERNGVAPCGVEPLRHVTESGADGGFYLYDGPYFFRDAVRARENALVSRLDDEDGSKEVLDRGERDTAQRTRPSGKLLRRAAGLLNQVTPHHNEVRSSFLAVLVHLLHQRVEPSHLHVAANRHEAQHGVLETRRHQLFPRVQAALVGDARHDMERVSGRDCTADEAEHKLEGDPTRATVVNKQYDRTALYGTCHGCCLGATLP
mmetsp:Transcript_43188/g.77400  ORF Transcript_43188/g.77400 Transcript_43188/m.77400 type:complete len:225 (+) Transcript_43188:499-1173(+)